MYDYKHLYTKMIILIVLQSFVHYYPDLQKYKNETRFNYYRSLMCMGFSMIGLHVGINHFKNGFSHPFSYQHNDMDEIQYLFMAYLIVDIIKMLADGNTRMDLYLHHIMCIISVIMAKSIDKYGYLHAMLLICESISIITGVDSMAVEDGDNILSYHCKRFRKNIINYVRLPMWIFMLMVTIRHTNKAPSLLWYNGLICSIVMIGLDIYWLKKCEKVIDKYEK